MTTTRNKLLLGKIEGTYGTDSAPVAATDAILVENLTWGHAGRGKQEYRPLKATMGPAKSTYAGALKTVSFDVRIKGSGTAGTAPEWGPLLRSCRFAETIVPVTSVTYDRHSSAEESCTLHLYDGPYLHKLTGCRGNVSSNFVTGDPGKLSFAFTGRFTDPTDAGAYPTPTFDATDAEKLLNIGFTVDGYAAKPSEFNFDCANDLALPPDMSAAEGYGEIEIADFTPQGLITARAEALATYNWFTKWKTDAEGALTTGAVGATAGNIWQLDMAAVAYRELTSAEIAQVYGVAVGYEILESAGDDQITLALT